MSRITRQEKEVRRLVADGRPVSAIRKDTDAEGREYHIAATLRRVGARYYFLMDVYYPTGTTGETIREEGMIFDDVDEANRYLQDASRIPLHEFRA